MTKAFALNYRTVVEVSDSDESFSWTPSERIERAALRSENPAFEALAHIVDRETLVNRRNVEIKDQNIDSHEKNRSLLALNNFLQTAVAFAWARAGVHSIDETCNRKINANGKGVKEADLDEFISTAAGTEYFLAQIVRRNFASLATTTGGINADGDIEWVITNKTLDKYIDIMNSHFCNHARMLRG
jgi:hypothetical protein